MAVATYLQRGDGGARRREIVTPEGIPIQFTLASIGERVTALVIDMVLIIVVIAAVAIAAGLATRGGEQLWLRSLALLVGFVVRHFYFVYFELRGHGATPGKRAAGIRVIDARGGSLEAGAVLARNLVRELELWMPLIYLLASSTVWAGAPAWTWLVASAWLVVLALLPLFNRDHLRIGDLIGGTLVVAQPRTQLRADLAAEPVDRPAPRATGPLPGAAPIAAPARAAAARFTFTEAQLEVYGVYELQVLEGLLRGEATADLEAVATVADRIRTKIGFAEPVRAADDPRFLRDFYTALRAHLEKRLLFGKRRADKHDRS